MAEDKVLTLHPQGKQGRRIDLDRYEMLRNSIKSRLEAADLTQNELVAAVEDDLRGKFSGSLKWYMETVKLDLEARGEIERYPSRPHDRYRLKG
jgi:hypothetical protein